MDNLKDFLIEFEEYLTKKMWDFKKYEIEDSFVYDIEESVVIFIEQKEEFSKKHITVREILNTIHDNDFYCSNIKIKPFCSKYIKEWVTYYPFIGEITEELKLVNNSKPSLKLLDRYEKWEGYRVFIAGFQLEDDNKKGYALVKYPAIGGIVELREIGKYLLNAYIDFITDNPTFAEGEVIIKSTNGFEFFINGNMAKILKERYINKYSLENLKKVKEIEDLKGFWTSIFQKNKKQIPYSLFENLENGKIDNINILDIYTENMKSRIPKLEDLDKKYYYVSVVYADSLESYDFYNYLSDDKSVKAGDKVLVNRAGDDVVALVTEARYYLGSEVPFPISRTKSIIKKIENDEELKKYGYNSEYFADYEFYEEDDGLETVKNQGRHDIKDRWQEIEDRFVDIVHKQNGDDTIQWIKPSEHLSYQMPEKEFEIYEEDFTKTMMDYIMYQEGIDVKEFSNKLIEKVMYSSSIAENGEGYVITLKGDNKDEK